MCVSIVSNYPHLLILGSWNSRMKRRTFLGSTVSSCLMISAGCLEGNNETYATVQQFDLLNTLEKPTMVELRIERSDTGDRVHNDRYELLPEDGIGLDCVWPDKPLEIATRRESNDSWSTLNTISDEGCMALAAVIGQDGISYLTSQERDCPVQNPDCHLGADQ